MFDFLSGAPGRASLSVVFLYGLLTGLHCVGMCGGLALSPAVASRGKGRARALGAVAAYNLGRLLSYAAAGVAVGALGGTVSLAPPIRGALPVAGGLLVVLMGLDALGILRLPRFDFALLPARRMEALSGASFLMGLATVLLPCGPLQAMLLYGMGLADAAAGGLALLAFAAGTVPALFVFGAAGGLLGASFSKVATRLSAVVLVVMGLAMAGRGLVLLGLDPSRIFTPSLDRPVVSVRRGDVQFLSMTFNPRGYPPIELVEGTPVRWVIRMDKKYSGACAANIDIPGFAVRAQLVPGSNLIEFVPDKTGVFSYSSWCGMISNVITVKEAASGSGETRRSQ